jgi:gas vesicle structural protein
MPWVDYAGEEHPPRLIDVLDRVLDKGVVIDAWVRMSAAGIDLVTVDARVVVASLETYLTRADAVRSIPWYGVSMESPRPGRAAAGPSADAPDLPASGGVVRAVEDYLRQLP